MPEIARAKMKPTKGILHTVKDFPESTIQYLTVVFYRWLGGTAPISGKAPVPYAAQPAKVIEIITIADDETTADEVIYLYTIRRNTQNATNRLPPNLHKAFNGDYFITSPYESALSSSVVTKALKKQLAADFSEEQADNLLDRGKQIYNFIVDAYLQCLCVMKDNMYTLNSTFYKSTSFLQDLKEKVRHRRLQLKSMKESELIFWPYCTDSNDPISNHFYLSVIKKNPSGKYSLYCLDGFNSEFRDVLLQKSKQLLEAVFPEKDVSTLIEEIRPLDIPKQIGVVDCGAAISYWALQFANNIDISSIPSHGRCNYSNFRGDIAQKLAGDNNRQTKLTLS